MIKLISTWLSQKYGDNIKIMYIKNYINNTNTNKYKYELTSTRIIISRTIKYVVNSEE